MDENMNEMSSASIRNLIKRDLLNGLRITPLYGFRQYGTGDLRKRLSELRNDDGLDITSEWATSQSGKKYKVHFMTEEAIAAYMNRNKQQAI